MERHFDSALRDLKDKLVGMAGQVEKAIELATRALLEHDATHLKEVFEVEKTINQLHIVVDESCLKLLALQQPLAKDLRLIVAMIKINTDLERMGDQAVNIAYNTQNYLLNKPLANLVDIPKMSEESRFMTKEALDAFVQGNLELARDVLKRDDKVDALKNKVFKDALEIIKNRPEALEQALSLILIARNLERIGDHATNIAEDVIFAVTGEDIRHGGNSAAIKEALK